MVDPYDVVVPYSKRTFVVSPRGFTDATSVAASPATERAAPRPTPTAPAGSRRSAACGPRRATTPAAFVATTR